MNNEPQKTKKKIRIPKAVKKLYEKHRKRLPLIIYILLLIAVAIYVSFVGGVFSYVLFYIVLFYPVISIAMIIINYLCIRVYQDSDGRLLYKNIETNYEFEIENIGIFPVSDIRIYHDEATSFRDEFTEESIKLMPGDSKHVKTKLICKYAGSYEAGVLSLSLRDMFGIMKITFNIQTFLRVSVLPTLTDIASADVNRVLEQSLNQNNIVALDTFEDYPGNEFRKYAVGDPLNRVHWKNYARSGRMFIRLPDRAESDMPGLVLIPREQEDKTQQFISRDYFLEYVVSIAWYFTQQKKPLMIYFYNGGVRNVIVSGLNSFQRFYMEDLNRISVMPDDEEEKELLESAGGRGLNLFLKEEDMELGMV
ncbi:MAG: DUF58 domain-containing protein [Eubacterium sp.]|nr:DUF58 domain-containing protein [Eubacterium sp.]